MHYIILDIETGGFSKRKNGICEIAYMCVHSTFGYMREKSFLIKPHYPRSKDVQETPNQPVSYKPDAMAIHGITIEEMERKGVDCDLAALYLFEEAFQSGAIKDITLVGHNIKSFDLPWIREFMENRGYIISENINVIDTLHLAKKLRPKGSKNDLGTLCKEYGIDTGQAHRAMSDVKATADLLKLLKAVEADM